MKRDWIEVADLTDCQGVEGRTSGKITISIEAGPDQIPKKCEIPLVVPCKFSAVINSARHSCAHLAASCAIRDNQGIKGLQIRPRCSPHFRNEP